MKKTIVTFLFAFLSLVIFGQTIDMDSIFEPKLCGEIFHLKARTIGHQFYNDDWATGDIKLCSGQMVHHKKLKLNILLNEVVWLPEDSFRFVKLEKNFIDEFWFKNDKGKAIHFKKIKYKAGVFMDSTEIFVEVLAQQKVSLYVFRNVMVQSSINQTDDGKMSSIDNLIPNPIYMIIFPGNKIFSLKRLNRRILLKALPGLYKSPVQDIIRQNHLRMHSEKDLLTLIDLLSK